MFKGYSTNEEGMIQFIIPPLKGQLREGVYQSRVEVLIENRYFSPLTFNLNFKKEMSVVVESVSVAKAAAPRVDVTPVPVVVKKAVSTPPAQVARSFVVEAEKRQQSKPVAVLKPVQVAHKVATLKERHVQQEPEIVDFDDVNEDLIRDITRSFARTVKK